MTENIVPFKNTAESQSPFDGIKQIDDQGREFWSARQLMTLLEYAKWDKFKTAIEKTRGQDGLSSCFIPFETDTKGRPRLDYRISRNGINALLKVIPSYKMFPRKKQPQKLYVIYCKECSVAKIGISACPEDRLLYIQTGHPFPLSLFVSIEMEDARLAERDLHQKLEPLRLNGEWFDAMVLGIVKWDSLGSLTSDKLEGKAKIAQRELGRGSQQLLLNLPEVADVILDRQSTEELQNQLDAFELKRKFATRQGDRQKLLGE